MNRTLMKECAHYPRLIVGIVAVSSATIIAVVAGPLLSRRAVNEALAGHTEQLWVFGALLMGIALLDFGGDYLRRYLAGKLSLRVQHRLRTKVFDAVHNLDGHQRDTIGAGNIIARLSSDVQQTHPLLSMCPVPLAVCTYYLCGIAVMVWLSPALSLITVAIVVALGCTAWFTRRRVIATTGRAQRELASMTEHVRELVDGIAVTTAFSQQPRELASLELRCTGLLRDRIASSYAQAVPGATLLGIPALGQVVLLIAGKWQIGTGAVDPGTFIAFVLYLGMLTGPTRVLASFLVIAQRTKASLDRIDEVLQLQPELTYGTLPAPAVGSISMRGLALSYPDAPQPAVRDIDLQVRPGETVALVGESGSGKTSIIQLAARMYDPTAGEIRFADRLAAELSQPELRDYLGVVFEEPYLFAGTIADNIRYGAPNNVTDAEVQEAIRLSGLGEVIAERGLAGSVTAMGRNLSGGQRQRIALARTLLRDPKVLLIDDISSSVDAHTEQLILAGLRSWKTREDRCALIVARRNSTAQLADRIIVLKDGQIHDTGTFTELKGRNPYFRALMGIATQDAVTPESTLATAQPEPSVAKALAAAPGEPSPRVREAALAEQRRTLLSMAAPARFTFLGAFAAIAVSALAQSALPILIQHGIDSPDYLLIGALALLVVVTDWFAQIAATRLSARASESVQYILRIRSVQHLYRIGVQRLRGSNDDDLLTRMTVDVDSLARFLQNSLANSLVSVLTMVGAASAMLLVSPTLAAVALAPLPFIIVATVAFKCGVARAYDQARDRIGKVNSYVQEQVGGMKTVQAAGQQGASRRAFKQLSERYRDSRERAQLYISLYFPFVVLMGQAAYALILVASAHLIARNELSLGAATAFLLLQALFYSPIQQLSNHFDALQQAVVGVRRLHAFLAEEPAATLHRDAAPAGYALCAREVSLRYYADDGTPITALDQVSFEVPQGAKVAIVGESGSGKTSLATVLSGLASPDHGTVIGADRVAYVPQEPFLFSGNVRDNLRYGAPEATQSQLYDAVRRAGLVADETLLATEVSSGGTNLPLTHRQLLALARAFVADHPIVILDETTSHLDHEQERVVVEQLLADAATAIVIAHRLSTARACDYVAVMARGRIVEWGTPTELLHANGQFASLNAASSESHVTS